jgi:hypothetical protein
MPNTREKEKLIELLDEASEKIKELCGGLNDHNGNGVRADHLIANGVKVQEYCKACAEATQNCIVKLQEQIAELRSVQKWIPLSEQKPNRDELVLVFFEGMRDTDCAIQVLYGWCIGGSASHWMPMPQPPKGE